VAVSSKGFSKKLFEDFYRRRWQVESEIKVLKAHGLERYMVRRVSAVKLWVMVVWHVVLLKLRSELHGIDFRRYLLSLVFLPIVLELIELVEFIQGVVRRCLRFSPFPDDRLVLLMLQNLIGGGSCHAKV